VETLRLIFLFLHLLGWAALFGGLLAQARAQHKVVNAPMRDGVGTAFLTGIVLVGLLEMDDQPVNYAKVTVKLVIGLVLLALVMANLRKERIPQGLWAGLLALTAVNVAVAVFWSPAHTG
jgi:peptidoglycan/LPS O-acetylase OafA/YrhL